MKILNNNKVFWTVLNRPTHMFWVVCLDQHGDFKKTTQLCNVFQKDQHINSGFSNATNTGVWVVLKWPTQVFWRFKSDEHRCCGGSKVTNTGVLVVLK